MSSRIISRFLLVNAPDTPLCRPRRIPLKISTWIPACITSKNVLVIPQGISARNSSRIFFLCFFQEFQNSNFCWYPDKGSAKKSSSDYNSDSFQNYYIDFSKHFLRDFLWDYCRIYFSDQLQTLFQDFLEVLLEFLQEFLQGFPNLLHRFLQDFFFRRLLLRFLKEFFQVLTSGTLAGFPKSPRRTFLQTLEISFRNFSKDFFRNYFGKCCRSS